MSNIELPVGTPIGRMSSYNVIGDVTESLHRFVLEGWDLSDRPPRLEEDLSFEPKDREEVIYIYMYRLAQNPNLQNQKRWRQAPVFLGTEPEDGGEVYYHRPPVLVDLFYMLMVHSKFRSDAERLLGWLMLRLNNATHLVYRPRRFLLPDGREVDSLGRPYDVHANPDEEHLVMEKVSLALVDDLTVGDATNFFSLHEAPYRPFLTYRARVALDGPLAAAGGGTQISFPPLQNTSASSPAASRSDVSASGRIRTGSSTNGNGAATSSPNRRPPGPAQHCVRRAAEAEAMKTKPEPVSKKYESETED